MTEEKKTARARKSPATAGAAAKKATARKKSATASLLSCEKSACPKEQRKESSTAKIRDGQARSEEIRAIICARGKAGSAQAAAAGRGRIATQIVDRRQ